MRLKHKPVPSFEDVFEQFKACREAARSKLNYAKQWNEVIRTYAADLLPVPKNKGDVGAVGRALQLSWRGILDTARRRRQLLFKVLAYAKARNLRACSNLPA